MNEERSGAIRMVAFGVLEPTNITKESRTRVSVDELFTDEESRLEVERLLMGEIKALGWKLAQQLTRSGHSKTGKYILLGTLFEGGAFKVRPKIGEGTLQEVCRAAVDYLDTGKTTTKEFRVGKEG